MRTIRNTIISIALICLVGAALSSYFIEKSKQAVMTPVVDESVLLKRGETLDEVIEMVMAGEAEPEKIAILIEAAKNVGETHQSLLNSTANAYDALRGFLVTVFIFVFGLATYILICIKNLTRLST